MIIITIIKNKKITNQAVFETEQEADVWLKSEIANGSFGEDYTIKLEYK